jgi:predicted transcriptional regulator
MLLKVKEHENLVRDTKSNAILNTDNRGLNAYKNRKMQFSKIDNMEDKIKHLDDKLINIENLLSSLAEKLDK